MTKGEIRDYFDMIAPGCRTRTTAIKMWRDEGLEPALDYLGRLVGSNLTVLRLLRQLLAGSQPLLKDDNE